MLNHKYTLLLAVIALLFVSCQEYKQNIYINEDGSGKFSMTYDIGEMMQMMENSMEALKEDEETEYEDSESDVKSMELDSAEIAELMRSIEENEEDEMEYLEEDEEGEEESMDDMIAEMEAERVAEEANQNPLSKAVSNFFDELEPKKGEIVDTSFTMYEIVPDSLKHLMSKPDFAKKMGIDILFNEEAKEAEVSILIDFDRYSQINEIFTSMKEMFGNSSDPSNNAQMEQIESQMPQADVNLKKGYIKVMATPFEDDMGEEMNFDDMEEEELKMMEMFFGGSISTTYHLPSKVLSCNNENAVIDGNKVTITEKILDMMKNKQIAGYEIKFKRIK